jgi:hypothetical protein
MKFVFGKSKKDGLADLPLTNDKIKLQGILVNIIEEYNSLKKEFNANDQIDLTSKANDLKSRSLKHINMGKLLLGSEKKAQLETIQNDIIFLTTLINENNKLKQSTPIISTPSTSSPSITFSTNPPIISTPTTIIPPITQSDPNTPKPRKKRVPNTPNTPNTPKPRKKRVPKNPNTPNTPNTPKPRKKRVLKNPPPIITNISNALPSSLKFLDIPDVPMDELLSNHNVNHILYTIRYVGTDTKGDTIATDILGLEKDILIAMLYLNHSKGMCDPVPILNDASVTSFAQNTWNHGKIVSVGSHEGVDQASYTKATLVDVLINKLNHTEFLSAEDNSFGKLQAKIYPHLYELIKKGILFVYLHKYTYFNKRTMKSKEQTKKLIFFTPQFFEMIQKLLYSNTFKMPSPLKFAISTEIDENLNNLNSLYLRMGDLTIQKEIVSTSVFKPTDSLSVFATRLQNRRRSEEDKRRKDTQDRNEERRRRDKRREEDEEDDDDDTFF